MHCMGHALLQPVGSRKEISVKDEKLGNIWCLNDGMCNFSCGKLQNQQNFFPIVFQPQQEAPKHLIQSLIDLQAKTFPTKLCMGKILVWSKISKRNILTVSALGNKSIFKEWSKTRSIAQTLSIYLFFVVAVPYFSQWSKSDWFKWDAIS